jgi:hypothetical protein
VLGSLYAIAFVECLVLLPAITGKLSLNLMMPGVG